MVLKWVEEFNKVNPDTLANLYHDEAINHQVYRDPLIGKAAIKEFFRSEFSMATMVCIVKISLKTVIGPSLNGVTPLV